MDVSKYPIKWGFGITSPSPWSASHPHLGVDRPAPLRTPLRINGQLVGYSGDSGGVDAHHHLQKVENGQVVNPGTGGFVVPLPATVYAIGTAGTTNIGKFIRIRDAKGVQWSHFHLDEVLVKTGQVIEGEQMYEGKTAEYWYKLAQSRAVLAEDWKRKYDDFADDRAVLVAKVARLEAQIAETNKAVGIKDGEITRLRTELATAGSDNVNLNALGAALRWLITRLGLKG